jgi:hypothetical protein
MRYLLSALLLLACYSLQAQPELDQTARKSFLILGSSRSFDAALKTAREASAGLSWKLDLRGLKPVKQGGLSFSAGECDSNGWEFPCYEPRGRYDDGQYISIEHSDAYTGFSKGYYLVVAASGFQHSAKIKAALNKARPLYKSAYVKTSKVYMGCMH